MKEERIKPFEQVTLEPFERGESFPPPLPLFAGGADLGYRSLHSDREIRAFYDLKRRIRVSNEGDNSYARRKAIALRAMHTRSRIECVIQINIRSVLLFSNHFEPLSSLIQPACICHIHRKVPVPSRSLSTLRLEQRRLRYKHAFLENDWRAEDAAFQQVLIVRRELADQLATLSIQDTIVIILILPQSLVELVSLQRQPKLCNIPSATCSNRFFPGTATFHPLNTIAIQIPAPILVRILEIIKRHTARHTTRHTCPTSIRCPPHIHPLTRLLHLPQRTPMQISPP